MSDYDAQPGRKTPPEPDLSDAQLEADAFDLTAALNGVTAIVADARSVTRNPRRCRRIRPTSDSGCRWLRGDAGVARGGVVAWAVTTEFVQEIDVVQYNDLGEGPCITCMQSRRPTISGSLGSDRRWPHFGGRVARMGVHSVLALPLTVGEKVVGAINTYAYERDTFSEHAVALGSQFAGPAAVSVYNAQLLASAQERTKQLQRALETRAVIDQAIGIIRSRTGVSTDEAFERLTKTSQAENIKLYVVAERLVEEAVRRARARRR